jgi:hypothetical protein
MIGVGVGVPNSFLSREEHPANNSPRTPKTMSRENNLVNQHEYAEANLRN